MTLGAFGVLVPLVLLFPARLPGLVRRHFDRALYVLSVYATLVISNNNERPLAYALPALVPAALWCLRAFIERPGCRSCPSAPRWWRCRSSSGPASAGPRWG